MRERVEAMALEYPSVSDGCSATMRGRGYWSEEASPLSSIGVNSLLWDELELEDFDPVDLLPTDPFGMNLETTLTAALASCIGGGAGRFGDSDGGAVSADLSYYLNQALALSREPLIGGYGSAFGGAFCFGGVSSGAHACCSQVLPPSGSCSQSIGFGEDPSTSGNATLACRDGVVDVPAQVGNAPHDGMMFALDFLGLHDILSVEMVCKSLHAAVRDNLLLWKCIHIEPALSFKIYDADLLRLTQKVPGSVQCLNIQDCINITDQGLKSVLESNPQLTKLNIDGCARLTLNGFIANLKLFNMKAVFGIKNLRIGRKFSLPKEYFKELLSLLRMDKLQKLHSQEPRFYHSNHLLSDCSGSYALDIEMCPICQRHKLVFDCPVEGCDRTCRGCYTCINRCLECGRCVKDDVEFEETFLLDCLCYDCLDDPVPSLTGQKHPV